jgi:putative ABC transport system permease protein
MFKNDLKVGLRNVLKNKMDSLLNIAGLSAGMAVTILIALWVWDELSFDRYHVDYKRIAQVMQSQVLNNETVTQAQVPIPLGYYLRTTYAGDFKRIVMSSGNEKHILAAGENKFIETGNFMEAEAPALFTLKMVQGSRDGLRDPSSILLSQSIATALFGRTNALGKLVRFDDDKNVKVTGVYEDLPNNTTLNKLMFIAPWEAMKSLKPNIHNWGNNGWQIYAELAENADLSRISAKIKNAKYDNADNGDQRFKPVIFLHPMGKWHLYAEFKNGVNTGGRVQYVWLLSIIGFFVLLLACINFMNLSTARSEKRAKEVGIRKAIGSLRSQLIYQFYNESLLMAFLAFLISIPLVLLLLPFFNNVAGKNIGLPWGNPSFWLAGTGFTIFTGLIAGSYPALYLSSFTPVKVLKGTFKAGSLAAIPRKALVVVQFTVSVILIIGTIVVFKQAQFAKNRPVGYDRANLLSVEVVTPQIHDHFDAFGHDLLQTGAVENVASSSTPVTETRSGESDFDWEGKVKSGNTQSFVTVGVSKEFGKTIGWQFISGRDYRSGPEGSDALGFVLNESAAKLMGFKNPVGQQVHWMGYTFTVIGLVKNMVMNSPFDPIEPTIFFMAPWPINVYNMRLNPHTSTADAVDQIATVFKKYSPSEPFIYKFADDEYARKFETEERIGKLAGFFAILAIFISCLGLFGMASFMAEQRVKEIGVRKVLGASVFSIWRLLSKDFLALVLISLAIAIPVAFLFMHNWLQHYTYRTSISWGIFVAAAAGAILITIIAVSYQGIKAALANPVKALRTQ